MKVIYYTENKGCHKRHLDKLDLLKAILLIIFQKSLDGHLFIPNCWGRKFINEQNRRILFPQLLLFVCSFIGKSIYRVIIQHLEYVTAFSFLDSVYVKERQIQLLSPFPFNSQNSIFSRIKKKLILLTNRWRD